MNAADYVFEILSHFIKETDGPPPGVHLYINAAFETDLVSLCLNQRLSRVVSASIDELALPPSISRISVARIQNHSLYIEKKNKERLRLASNIISAFNEEKVRSAILGGAWTSSLLFPIAVMRPLEHLDFIIDEQQWREAVGVLREMGFVRSRIQPRLAGGGPREGEEALYYHHYFAPLLMHNQDGDLVQLRFRVIDFGHPERVDTGWERLRDVTVAGTQAKAVSAEDQLVHSIITFGAEGFIDLLHVVDAGFVLNHWKHDLDWGYITGRVRIKGLYPAFFHTLEHICALLHLGRMAEACRRPTRLRRRLFEMFWKVHEIDYTGDAEPVGGRFVYYLVEGGGILAKARWLRRALFPRSSWVKSVYGRPSNLWLRFKFLYDVRIGRRYRTAGDANTQFIASAYPRSKS